MAEVKATPVERKTYVRVTHGATKRTRRKRCGGAGRVCWIVVQRNVSIEGSITTKFGSTEINCWVSSVFATIRHALKSSVASIAQAASSALTFRRNEYDGTPSLSWKAPGALEVGATVGCVPEAYSKRLLTSSPSASSVYGRAGSSKCSWLHAV